MRTKLILVAVVMAMLVAWRVVPTVAQSGGTYDLTWNSIDGGGVTFASGGTYSLGGTMGQPDAGVMSGGGYALAGGFWSALNTGGSTYMPVINR